MKTDQPVVVLAPGFHGHGIIRSLGRLGVPVHAVHRTLKSPAARSRFSKQNLVLDLEQEAPDRAVRFLADLSESIGTLPLLIPTDDHSCLFVADHHAELSSHYRFPAMPSGLARSLSSKDGMYKLCAEHGIPTPRTEFPRERADVESYARNGEFPVVVKGIETALLKKRAGKTAIRVEDAEALLKAYDELETPNAPNLMIQEYIPGGSEDIWMFDGYFDASSRCLFGVTGQKIRQHPPYAGVTSLGICRANPVVVSQTTEFMKALGYQGILDLGYKCDPRTGEYKLLDVNPRVGTTFRLFVDSHGMDVVRALYLDMTGQPVTCGELVEGRKWVVENFDLVSGFRCWRDGNLSLLSWPLSYRGVREASWFAVDDPMPFLVMVWRSLQWSHGTRFGKRDMSEEMHPVMAA